MATQYFLWQGRDGEAIDYRPEASFETLEAAEAAIHSQHALVMEYGDYVLLQGFRQYPIYVYEYGNQTDVLRNHEDWAMWMKKGVS
jgi:hypothetical protein